MRQWQAMEELHLSKTMITLKLRFGYLSHFNLPDYIHWSALSLYDNLELKFEFYNKAVAPSAHKYG